MNQKAYYIFLDDVRVPRDVTWVNIPNKPWSLIRNYNDFVEYIQLKGYLPQIISFDHDLGPLSYSNENDGSEKTGLDCAKWIVEYCEKNNAQLPQYFVHSMNPIGVENIEALFRSYRFYKLNEKRL